MNTLTICRNDFRECLEADFFADICIALHLATSYEDAEDISSIEVVVDSATAEHY